MSIFSFAQKKNTNKPEVVIVAGRVLSSEDSVRVTQLYYEGIKEKVVGNTVLAIDYFNQILQLDPANYNSSYELAQIYFGKGDLIKAQEFAQKAVTVKTDNEWYWLLLANIYQQQQNYNLLNYALDELIKLSPQKLEYSFDKADALLSLDKSEDALKIYNQLEVEIGLTDKILQGRQRIYLKKGEVDKAVVDLNQLIKNNPSDVRYYLYLGDLYYSNKRLDEALSIYQKAKQLDISNPFTHLAIAQILESKKRPADAYQEYLVAFQQPDLNIDQKVKIVLKYFDAFPDQNAVKYAEQLSEVLTNIHPDNPKAFSIYGDVLYQKNNLKYAKIAYEKALALNKNVYAIWDQLCRIELSLGDGKALIITGEEALSLFPNQYGLYFYTALGYLQNNQDQTAISYLNNALSYDIENKALKSQIYSSLGDAYQSLKKYKESADAYDKALNLSPNNTYVLNNYAYYLSLRGENLDKAEKMSAKSNQLEANSAAFEDTYAWVLFKNKKYADAKIWIEKAISHNEKSATQFDHLGDILFKLGDIKGAVENWGKSIKLDGSKELVKRKINEKKYLE
nr:tetratricopeptide repeat protein [Pseudopedobacter sp.]